MNTKYVKNKKFVNKYETLLYISTKNKSFCELLKIIIINNNK